MLFEPFYVGTCEDKVSNEQPIRHVQLLNY